MPSTLIFSSLEEVWQLEEGERQQRVREFYLKMAIEVELQEIRAWVFSEKSVILGELTSKADNCWSVAHAKIACQIKYSCIIDGG